MNVVSMNDPQRAARGGLSILSLQFEVVDDRPDRPVVRVLVDGQNPFASVAPGWRGFDPLRTRDGAWHCTAARAGSPGAVSSLP